jgi:hypothetical protein
VNFHDERDNLICEQERSLAFASLMSWTSSSYGAALLLAREAADFDAAGRRRGSPGS